MKYLEIREFIKIDTNDPIIDVRSPNEYRQGHIPGAVNIPLFADDERAEIGTTYKKEGKAAAVKKGLKVVGPKMAAMLEQLEKVNTSKEVRIHCWRGGMRSSSVAWLFETAGYTCTVLEGGYKSYRGLMVNLFDSFDIVLIGGETGSGKTLVLEELRQLGEQIIDLEELANHRGSAFGAVGMSPQPTVEQFQNLIIEGFLNQDINRKIYLEDESSHIGKVSLPDTLWHKMKASPILYISVPLEFRIERLVEEYGKNDKDELKVCMKKIERKLGGQNLQAALKFLDKDDLASVARIMLYYYDKSYRFLLDRNKDNIIGVIEITDPEPRGIARNILDKISEKVEFFQN